MKIFFKGLWRFISYLFWSHKRLTKRDMTMEINKALIGGNKHGIWLVEDNCEALI